MAKIKKVIPGDYLYCPRNRFLIKVMEVYQQKKQDGEQWFSYQVVQGDKDPMNTKFHYGSKKHNGWDYNNSLLDWILIDDRNNLSTLSVLYGKT